MLAHENDKLNFRYKHHKVEKMKRADSIEHEIKSIKEKMAEKFRRM